MNRTGLEFAIGTLVTMILGVLVIGLGLAFVWNLVDEGTDVAEKLTGAQERELESLLSAGRLVAVSPQQRTIEAGRTGTFGVAVLNRLDATTAFTIDVLGYDKEQQPVPSAWTVSFFPELAVGVNQDKRLVVAITPPEDAPAGIYTFAVTVRENGAVYDSPRIFTVSVP